jgi:hypothetical protein
VEVERRTDNLFTVTATGAELSALVAGARMALGLMRRSPEQVPPEVADRLEAIIADYQSAADRLAGEP